MFAVFILQHSHSGLKSKLINGVVYIIFQIMMMFDACQRPYGVLGFEGMIKKCMETVNIDIDRVNQPARYKIY